MRKLWKAMKRTVIVAVTAFAVLLIVLAVLNWRASRRLERHVVAIREAGDPVTLADLARDAVPAGQNAETYLRRVADDVVAMNKELYVLYSQPDAYYVNGKADGKLNEAGADLVRATFAAYPDAFLSIENAANCPELDAQLDFTLDPLRLTDNIITEGSSRRREIARLLKDRADLQLHDDDRDAALETCLQILRFGRLADRDPFLVSYLVAISIRNIALDRITVTLQDGPVSSTSRQRLEQELQRHEDMSGYTWCLKSERAFGLAQFRFMTNGLVGWLPTYTNDQADYLELLERELLVAGLPRYEADSEIKQIRQQAATSGALTQGVFPALHATRDAVDRTRANMRCLRVLNAWLAYSEEHGAPPEPLVDLGLDSEALVDPYNGQPLVVKETPEGLIVYSVGADGIDDGGTTEGMKDEVAGPVAIP